MALCLLALLLLAGCGTTVIKSGSGTAPGASFWHRVTFQFIPESKASGIARTANSSQDRDLIGREILARMNIEGYRYFTNRKTDFLVSYQLFVSQEEAAKYWNSYSGYKFAPGIGAQSDFVRSPKIAPNVLVIDTIDPRQKKLIWRGWATLGPINASETVADRALIKIAVKQILTGLPKRN
jgi:Domain of unknown function (DUF4136)